MVGIDLTPVEPIVGATVLAKDFYDEDAPKILSEHLGGLADVVLSDEVLDHMRANPALY